jgi:hypothetical protein
MINAANEAALLKTLEEVGKQIEEGGKSTKEILNKLDVPSALKTLTIFQNLENFDWCERDTADTHNSLSLGGGTDNSNTQFALLALWVAQRHGIPINLTFRLMVERFERCQLADGRWPYRGNYDGSSRSHLLAFRSMTCVGLLALGIGRGMKLPTPGSPPPGREDLRVLGGLTALYQLIGTPEGSMNRRVPHQDLYFLWAVERVGMLYNLPTIGNKDWYRWEAQILVTHQMSSGSWPGTPWQREVSAVSTDYGLILNTAFALLVLKRSHPMKDLTPKLPFTAKELNEGITRLRKRDNFLAQPTTAPNSSKGRGP